MNLIKKILSPLYQWFWKIPQKFGILATAVYVLLMYLIFGTLEVVEIKRTLGSVGIGYGVGVAIPFGIPMLVSVLATFTASKKASSHGNSKTDVLKDAINYRNGQMGVSTDKKAAEIYLKTAHLDVMLANQESDVMRQANTGFNATYGTSSPTTIFKDMTKK